MKLNLGQRRSACRAVNRGNTVRRRAPRAFRQGNGMSAGGGCSKRSERYATGGGDGQRRDASGIADSRGVNTAGLGPDAEHAFCNYTVLIRFDTAVGRNCRAIGRNCRTIGGNCRTSGRNRRAGGWNCNGLESNRRASGWNYNNLGRNCRDSGGNRRASGRNRSGLGCNCSGVICFCGRLVGF